MIHFDPFFGLKGHQHGNVMPVFPRRHQPLKDTLSRGVAQAELYDFNWT
jgi:hypothetical protein